MPLTFLNFMLHYLFRNRLNPSSYRAREEIREGNILMIIGLAGLVIMAIFFVIYLNNKFHLIRNFSGISSAPVQGQTTPVEDTTPTYKDTLPLVFLGRWAGTTLVTDSNMEDVLEGDVVQANVRFFHQETGLTGMMTEQPGWQLNSHSIIRINEREVVITRSSEFISEANRGTLTAVSKDHYYVVSANEMTCESRVRLYENGEGQGAYTTFTELFRF